MANTDSISSSNIDSSDNITDSTIESSDNITEELTKLLNNVDCKNKPASENVNTSDSSQDLVQVRADILKLLEMVNDLKAEVRGKNRQCDSDTYQESLDKILSVKLDELSVKVDNRINELSKVVNNTRNIIKK